jgi:phage antirepressor YoqD-like protein
VDETGVLVEGNAIAMIAAIKKVLSPISDTRLNRILYKNGYMITKDTRPALCWPG